LGLLDAHAVAAAVTPHCLQALGGSAPSVQAETVAEEEEDQGPPMQMISIDMVTLKNIKEVSTSTAPPHPRCPFLSKKRPCPASFLSLCIVSLPHRSRIWRVPR